jgi:hypothetical protein
MRLFIDKGVRLGVISLLVFGFLGCAPKSQESAKTSDSSKGTPTASIDFQTTTPRRTALGPARFQSLVPRHGSIFQKGFLW